jgi:hypothetical protein
MNNIIHIIKKIPILKHLIPKNIIPKQLTQREPPKLLGRWNINYCTKTMNSKVDLANEDHCGPCGQYAILKKQKDNTPKK